MLRGWLGLAWLVVVSAVQPARAEPPPAGGGYFVHNLFLPESYVHVLPVSFRKYQPSPSERDLGPAHLPLLYEARVAPHLFFYSNLARLGFRQGFALSFSFTPDLVLRQLSGGSLPVSSPSFRPTLNLQLFVQRVRNTWPKVKVHMFVPQLSLGHYSNGSAAETRTDGNFSMQRLGLALGYRWMRFLNDSRGLPSRPQQALELSLGYDYNLPPLERALQRDYGEGRTVLSAAHEWTYYGELERSPPRQFRLRSALEVTLANGVGSGVPFWSTVTSVAMTFRRALGFGPSLRLVNGSDYYNIRYAQRFDAISVGVIWEGAVLEYPQAGIRPGRAPEQEGWAGS